MIESTKYPRSIHYAFSPGTTSDDRLCTDHSGFIERVSNEEKIDTEKLDGQNNCLKDNGVFARSHGAPSQHPWDKHLWDKWDLIKKDLKTLEIFGENMYATHSIEYLKLEHHFYVFAIRDRGVWLSWDEVEFYAAMLDFPTVPVIYRGKYVEHPFMSEYKFSGERYEKFNNDPFARSVLATVKEESLLYGIDCMEVFKDAFKSLAKENFDPKKKYEGNMADIIIKIKKMDLEGKMAIDGMKELKKYKTKEGIITKLTREFTDEEFALNLRKYVRKGHVQTDEHWTRNWYRNKLSWEYKFGPEILI